jgi:hypothetical protein
LVQIGLRDGLIEHEAADFCLTQKSAALSYLTLKLSLMVSAAASAALLGPIFTLGGFTYARVEAVGRV